MPARTYPGAPDGETMHLEFTAEQRSLQCQLREYFEDLVVEAATSDLEEPAYTHYIRRMGQDGWLGLGWPMEYGGQARGAIDQMIFVEESHWAGVRCSGRALGSRSLRMPGRRAQGRCALRPGAPLECFRRRCELPAFPRRTGRRRTTNARSGP